MTTTTRRPLFEIANEIQTEWSKIGKGVSVHAQPYLDAMKTLTSIKDDFHQDSAGNVIRYFLCNATTFKGESARRIKKELKKFI